MHPSTNTLGRYQILREIARSNDIVYEAVDPRLGRRIALKELQLPASVTAGQRQERVQRFYREAKAAGGLAHPNIVTIYEVGEENGRHFIAMEFLEGESLRERLQKERKLPPAEALRIAAAVADGLAFAHRAGVIHRDVKPDNVHLLPDGQVKLTDFGIARLTFEPNLTATGQIFGTPSYMSPEQVVGKEIDARSDLFSLGVMLYEMLSGHKPFTGDSVITITYNIVHTSPPALTGVHPALDAVVRRALAKDPRTRFDSAADLAAQLRSLTSLAGAAAPTPTPRPAAAPPTQVIAKPVGVAGGAGVAAVPRPSPQLLLGSPAARPTVGQSPVGLPKSHRPAPFLSPETTWFLKWLIGSVTVALVVLVIAWAMLRPLAGRPTTGQHAPTADKVSSPGVSPQPHSRDGTTPETAPSGPNPEPELPIELWSEEQLLERAKKLDAQALDKYKKGLSKIDAGDNRGATGTLEEAAAAWRTTSQRSSKTDLEVANRMLYLSQEKLARAHINVGIDLKTLDNRGNREAARKEFQDAVRLAPKDSSVAQDARVLLNELDIEGSFTP